MHPIYSLEVILVRFVTVFRVTSPGQPWWVGLIITMRIRVKHCWPGEINHTCFSTSEKAASAFSPGAGDRRAAARAGPWAGRPPALPAVTSATNLNVWKNEINITRSCAAEAMISLMRIHWLLLIPSQAGCSPCSGQPLRPVLSRARAKISNRAAHVSGEDDDVPNT